MPNPGVVRQLLSSTVAVVGPLNDVPSVGLRSFQHTLTSTAGNCTATVAIEVSADGTNFMNLSTTTFSSAASPQFDGFTSQAPWPFVRANLTAITGTGARVVTTMAQQTP